MSDEISIDPVECDRRGFFGVVAGAIVAPFGRRTKGDRPVTTSVIDLDPSPLKLIADPFPWPPEAISRYTRFTTYSHQYEPTRPPGAGYPEWADVLARWRATIDRPSDDPFATFTIDTAPVGP